jgi:hypothetical protein
VYPGGGYEANMTKKLSEQRLANLQYSGPIPEIPPGRG